VRFLARLGAAAIIVAALSLLTSSPASAATDNLAGTPCLTKDAPTAVMPDSGGVTGFFLDPPNPLPPENADPFGPHPNATIYEVYGLNGFQFHTYNRSCSSQSAVANSLNALANVMLEFGAKTFMAAEIALQHTAFHPTFLHPFDPLIVTASRALGEGIFVAWVPVTFMLLGFLVLMKATRGSLTSTVVSVGWGMLIFLLAVAVLQWPVTIGSAADKVVPATIEKSAANMSTSMGHSGDPTTASAGMLTDAILWNQWVRGTFGAPSPAVAKYAPLIFKAQTFSWREAAEIEKLQGQAPNDPCDPDDEWTCGHDAPATAVQKIEKIYDDKADQWKDAADGLAKEDPSAYSYLVGDHPESRLSSAFIACLAAVLVLPFLFLSCFLLLACYLIWRLGVVFFPVFATVGMISGLNGVVWSLMTTMMAAAVNAIAVAVGANVFLLATFWITDPSTGLAGWLGLALLGGIGVLLWYILRPFMSPTRLVSARTNVFAQGISGPGEAVAGGWGFVKRTASTAAGGYIGGVAALKTAAGDGSSPVTAGGDDDRSPRPYRIRAEQYTKPEPGMAEPLALPATPTPDPGRAPLPQPVPVPVEIPVEPARARRETGSSPAAEQAPPPRRDQAGPEAPQDPEPRREPVEAPQRIVDGNPVHVLYRPDEDEDATDPWMTKYAGAE